MTSIHPQESHAAPEQGTLGRLLKEWRGRRGFSQLDLALAARTTQRHLSFIESGRAVPSRDMVLRLAATMDLPLRQQNALLLAAGYAPAWRERALSAPGLEAINRALDYILGQHEPFPAFVVDRRWNLLRANRGGVKLTEFLTGPVPASPPSAEPINLAMALMSPDGLRPLIANWTEVAVHFLRGVQADAQSDGTPETHALLTQLQAREISRDQDARHIENTEGRRCPLCAEACAPAGDRQTPAEQRSDSRRDRARQVDCQSHAGATGRPAENRSRQHRTTGARSLASDNSHVEAHCRSDRA
jgi:transcriptional regulator with XRE-family HTH domain